MPIKHTDRLVLPRNLDRSRAAHRPLDNSQLSMVQLFAEAGFNAVFDSSGEALVVVDSAGGIQKANQRARDLLRLRDSGMEGARLEDFVSVVPTQQLMRLWADPTSPRILDTSLASGFPIRITLRSLVPGSQNLLLCLEEGSVVHRAEAKWRQAEAELRSVLDSVQTGILLVLPSGRIRLASALRAIAITLARRMHFSRDGDWRARCAPHFYVK